MSHAIGISHGGVGFVGDHSNRSSVTTVTPLADLLVRSATNSPEHDALVLPGERYSYEEVLARSVAVSRGLLALGVGPRQHVGILAPNGIEYVEALFGSALIGAVVVPINARHRTSELAYIVEHADLRALITTGSDEQAHVDFSELLLQAFPDLAAAQDPSRLHLPAAPRLRSVVLLRGREQPGFLHRSAFEGLAEGSDHFQVHELRSRVCVRDPAMILYTSGTTANPKGCVLSHEALTRGAVHRAATRYGTGIDDVTWGAGPLFHIGCLSPFLGSIGTGGTYLTDSHFDATRAIALLTGERATVAFPWFPAIMQPILEHPAFDASAFSALRSILLIGPRPLIERVQDILPRAELIAACGMTEAAGIYALSDRSETIEERSEAQGKAADGVEVRVVDVHTGKDLPDGQRGEILLRGYTVMDGYYRDPDRTAAVLDADHWLRTGDIYSRTADGRLVFHDRLKDMLKVGGENVATLEIESFLCRHPCVRMAAVVGRSDPVLDEVPVAFVELVDSADVTPSELIAFCQGHIARYKIPAEVVVVKGADWPMSATKIDKRVLRSRVAARPQQDAQ